MIRSAFVGTCLLLGVMTTAVSAEKVEIPAGSFHGGTQVTYYADTDKIHGEGYEAKARQKVAIYPRGVEGSQISATVTLDKAPGKATLELIGLDDPMDETTPIAVAVGDKTVHTGASTFKNNPHEYRPSGWSSMSFDLPAGTLKAGENKITVSNLTDGYGQVFKWLYIHKAILHLPDGTKATLAPGQDFLGRIYLDGQIEPVCFPAAIKDNVIHLMAGRFLRHHFSYMIDQDWAGKEATLQLDVPEGIEISYTSNEYNEAGTTETVTRDGKSYTRFNVTVKSMGTMPGRRISYTRAYPRISLKPAKAGDYAPLYVRFFANGQAHPERSYAIKSWPDNGAKLPRPEKFFLGLWGGGIPQDAKTAEDYGPLLKDNGYDLVFGTTDEHEANYFKQHGIKFYTRFGPQHSSTKHPSIRWDGSEDTKHADPIHLIYDASAIEYPTFQRGINAAKQPWVDGVCCDYETLADSWSERSIAEFKRFAPEYANHTLAELKKLATNPDTGQYEPDRFQRWMDYRRWLNARIVGRIGREMHKIAPDMPYLSLASASDMPSYWWDSTGRGRFRLRDLMNNVQQVAVSTYHYDNPGGLPSIPAIVDTARRFAVGKEADVQLIGIYGAGTLIELYRYGKLVCPAWAVRMDILLAAMGGAEAFHFFSGLHVDGEYLHQSAQALAEVATLEPIVEGMAYENHRISASFIEQPEYALPFSGNPIIGQKLLWNGSAELQSVQMLRIDESGRMVALLFNLLDKPAKQTITIVTDEAGASYKVKPVLGEGWNGPEMVTADKGFACTTPAHSLLALELTPIQ